MEILGVRNIGKVIGKRLYEIEIDSFEKLKSLGTEEVFLRLYKKNKNTSKSILYSVEGAIEGIGWRNINPARKQELEIFFNSVTNSMI